MILLACVLLAVRVAHILDGTLAVNATRVGAVSATALVVPPVLGSMALVLTLVEQVDVRVSRGDVGRGYGICCCDNLDIRERTDRYTP